jgi:hypothetical protein
MMTEAAKPPKHSKASWLVFFVPLTRVDLTFTKVTTGRGIV